MYVPSSEIALDGLHDETELAVPTDQHRDEQVALEKDYVKLGIDLQNIFLKQGCCTSP